MTNRDVWKIGARAADGALWVRRQLDPAATALARLLGFRRDCTIAVTAAEQAEASAKLVESAEGLARASEAVSGFLELARMTAASGRKGKQDLNWASCR